MMNVAFTAPPACRAPYVMAQMQSAEGGHAWSGIAETIAFGSVVDNGLKGTARIDSDLKDGRYAQDFDVPGMGSTSLVFDGTSVWQQDISGGVHPFDTPFASRRAITNSYLSRREYFDRNSDAAFTCVGMRMQDGRSVVVIRVQPRGGIAADLSIDPQTHLLARVSEQLPLASDDGVTRYADYRTIDGAVLPFSISQGTETAPADGDSFEVARYVLLRNVNRADFAKPVTRNDAVMVGGATSSTVKMLLEGRQLIVWASIDAHPAMPFILDTGGHAILTTQAAKALGLVGRGSGQSGGSGAGTISTQYTHVASVRLGNAELRDQSFLVIPYPYSFYERGKNTPLAGILGLEFFERFAIRLDYGDRTVTFTPLTTFRHQGNGRSVSLMFEDSEDMPVVTASADGYSGLFGTDTGNAGILILFGDYLKRTGLFTKYTGGEKTLGQGTGGSNTGRRETLRVFTIGGRRITDILSNFTQMTSGSFSSRTEAGNMGFSILSRFVPTFDYQAQTLYLDPAMRATPFGANRAGLRFAKNAPEAFDVLLVDPGSAAALAGIVAGDRIVSINGKDASNYSWADLVAMIGEPRGTTLQLRVQRDGNARDITLVLR